MVLAAGPVAVTALAAAFTAAAQRLRDERFAGFLPLRCPFFYVRCATYSAWGVLIAWLCDSIPTLMKFGGFTDVSRYIVALFLGLAIPALLKVSLGTLRVANTEVPLGLSAIATPFDEALCDAINACMDQRISKFLDEHAEKFWDLERVQAMIRANIPDRLDRTRREKFWKKLEMATSARHALELYLRFVHKADFQSVFRLG
jgi:hypothetical protein